jgi:hypothetical protein
MAPSARHSSARDAYGPYAAYGAHDQDIDADWDVLPGERIGPPPRRRWGKLLLLGFVACLGFGAWGLLTGRVAWPDWLPNDPAAVVAWFERNMPQRAERAAPTVSPPPEPMPKLATVDVPPESALMKERPVQPALEKSSTPLTTGSLPSSVKSENAPVEPLPPVAVDPSDPHQKRALAVGLHPGLSRVLLTRMSDADYKNAGIAIQRAVADTPDSGVLLWPPQHKGGLALFRVSFVAGAPGGCRRYVVAITKDRWLTTALPMEKCGTPPRQARRG